MRVVRAFLADIRGATAIEYGLIAALISVALIGGAQVLGGDINSILSYIANQFPN
ncbi:MULTISPECIES: Flp family type IVb pilin [unclassified Rhizobium]|uniref:Flp family type IVb pilin n=1 Tax=unclassified Rhizobium TaxID=2613769 RepID=UPI0002715399|nr:MULTISPECIES: Flp family type IVb pilin [unclassified Rhizobium]EJL56855.1 Flp pilus assembly protein, pilin Flp [Rhizobium sp. CF122]MBB3399159.1 pilus assembly protein Flp/PilA [Rhizobium sp. BK060]MBB4171617.1 pilus assembly protein Flp/PilA [Rhizobium sp. BK538]TCM67181.1 pilus assembly protein Flp/PilA [Rhizobium sp. BK068]